MSNRAISTEVDPPMCIIADVAILDLICCGLHTPTRHELKAPSIGSCRKARAKLIGTITTHWRSHPLLSKLYSARLNGRQVPP